jgi:hypothetical protein
MNMFFSQIINGILGLVIWIFFIVILKEF